MAAVKTETVAVRNEMSTNHNLPKTYNRLENATLLELLKLMGSILLPSLDFEQFRSGAVVPTLNRNHVHGMPVTLPPEVLISDFQTLAEPMNRLANSLSEKNETLRQTGNLLLPKLISGELDVSELDIATNREAA